MPDLLTQEEVIALLRLDALGLADPRESLRYLRRTFVRQLAMAGVSAAVAQRLAGHASIATTVKYYTGIMPEALREAAGRLPFGSVISDISKSYRRPVGAVSGRKGKIVRLVQATG